MVAGLNKYPGDVSLDLRVNRRGMPRLLAAPGILVVSAIGLDSTTALARPWPLQLHPPPLALTDWRVSPASSYAHRRKAHHRQSSLRRSNS